jgi:hypothetical protein
VGRSTRRLKESLFPRRDGASSTQVACSKSSDKVTPEFEDDVAVYDYFGGQKNRELSGFRWKFEQPRI